MLKVGLVSACGSVTEELCFDAVVVRLVVPKKYQQLISNSVTRRGAEYRDRPMMW
jgi:hypothetical protein